jgi:hypothetical protein
MSLVSAVFGEPEMWRKCTLGAASAAALALLLVGLPAGPAGAQGATPSTSTVNGAFISIGRVPGGPPGTARDGSLIGLFADPVGIKA